MMTRMLGLAVAAVCCLGMFTACTSSLPIKTLEPGPVNLGATKQLSIVSGEGRRSARETVYNKVIEQARSRGYFTVDDRSEEGIEVKIAGRTATMEGGEQGLADDTVGLRIDVLEWDASQNVRTSTKTDSKGNERTVETRMTEGEVVLAVTAFDKEGKTFIAEKEYVGKASSSDKSVSEDTVIDRAAEDAVRRMLADITPKQVTRKVRLDDDEEAMEPFIETAQAGNIAQAITDLKAYREKNPNSSAAAYNLAVLTDATGDYDAALALYDKAMSLGNKDFYSKARAACASRKAAAEALQQ